jgi:hypothetical protein
VNYRRADDILLITDPNNPDNRDFYNRVARRGVNQFSITVGEH